MSVVKKKKRLINVEKMMEVVNAVEYVKMRDRRDRVVVSGCMLVTLLIFFLYTALWIKQDAEMF